jgi:hypothetical protein
MANAVLHSRTALGASLCASTDDPCGRRDPFT